MGWFRDFLNWLSGDVPSSGIDEKERPVVNEPEKPLKLENNEEVTILTPEEAFKKERDEWVRGSDPFEQS